MRWRWKCVSRNPPRDYKYAFPGADRWGISRGIPRAMRLVGDPFPANFPGNAFRGEFPWILGAQPDHFQGNAPGAHSISRETAAASKKVGAGGREGLNGRFLPFCHCFEHLILDFSHEFIRKYQSGGSFCANIQGRRELWSTRRIYNNFKYNGFWPMVRQV